jgi:hypothetical protein
MRLRAVLTPPPPRNVAAAYQAGSACAIIALATQFDVWATWIALRLGVREANPLFADLLNSPSGELSIPYIAAIKGLTTVVILVATWIAIERNRLNSCILTALRITAMIYLALSAYHVIGLSLKVASL